ncbi:MAG: glycosyltransferase family 4 protein [Abditibacteriales bacterium]|nr:glycosyltransferase family 4 protein [Abditibacteriales bacterium]MDW8368092.1 glycosyltransferase family 4 protein [Abditibacteriales bacterium]
MDSSRPRVLFYSTYPFWGGSEKFWYETVLDARFRDRIECHVMLADNPNMRPRAEHLKSLGVAVIWYPSAEPGLVTRIGRRLRRTVRPKEPPWEERYWLNVLGCCRPSLVWFNLATLSDVMMVRTAAAACRTRSVPYWLIVQQAFEQFFLRSDAETERFAAIVEGAQRVVCIAERNRMSLERAIGRRLNNVWMTVNALPHEFVERAVALSHTHPVRTEGTARLLNLARFDPMWKGHHILLEILGSRRWQHRDWRLRCQGGGYSPKLVERLVSFYGVPADRVELCGNTDDVLTAIGECDLFVMPSLCEGTPYALVEAMACARPVVGTPVGGIPELVVEGETGWLSDSTEVADVADALERAWAARQQWREYGARAQALIASAYDQQHTIPTIIQALCEDAQRVSSWALTPARDVA